MADATDIPPDPEVAPPQSELNEFLNRLAEQSPDSFMEAQRKVVEDVQTRCDRYALRQLQELGIPLRRLVEQWNRRLRLSLRQDVPPERILCGVNSVADVVYLLNDKPTELDAFVSWVAAQEGQSPQGVRNAVYSLSRGPLLTRRIEKPLEMLAALLQAMEKPNEEWKPRIVPALWEKVQAYVYGRRSAGATVEFRMGGASGNMAYVLSQLGLDTTAHWLYHPPEIASGTPERLRRLHTDYGQKVEEPAAVEGTYTTGTGGPQPDPVRRSFVFDFTKGLGLSGTSVSAIDSGRVIFIVDLHLSNNPKPWTRLLLRTTTPTGRQENTELEGGAQDLLGDKGWPFFPVFASKRVEGNALVVELANDEVMQRVAEQFDYLMLAGIQALGNDLHRKQTLVQGNPSEPTADTLIKHALMRQLDSLAGRGVVIHWEIGGISSPQLLDDLSDIVRGRVKSAGLNDGELRAMTEGEAFRQTRYRFSPPPGQQSAMLTRYDRAVHLARQLDLDELYVHGNDVDLIVRRRTTRGALRQEIAVTLFAKGVVLLTLLQRSCPDWRAYISAMNVPPVLKADGFIALLGLAKSLAMRHFPNNEPLEQRTVADIVQSGYYYERHPDDYSVMVVPVMWPELDIPFSTAGAGDITSSVVAAYAGK